MPVALRRALTVAESHIAVEEIDKLLNAAKDELDRAIQDEQRRAARLASRGRKPRLAVTEAMLAILQRLHQRGREHAAKELRSMGYPTRNEARQYVVHELDPWAKRLRSMLGALTIRVEQERIAANVSDATNQSIYKALLKVPGARDVASRLVSGAFASGLGTTFEANADLVDAWQYTAIMDGATCDVCESADGEEFDSWEAIQEVLPNGGPNPDCLGGERCRCRAVPVPP